MKELARPYRLVELGQKMVFPPAVRVLLSAGKLSDKELLFPEIEKLYDLGVVIFATVGTHNFLLGKGVKSTRVYRISEKTEPNIKTLLSGEKFDLVINILTHDKDYDEKCDNEQIRSYAHEQDIPLATVAEDAKEIIVRMIADFESKLFDYQSGAKTRAWDLKDKLIKEVEKRGGWVNNHSHFDKAYVINDANLALGDALMERKWKLFNFMKKGPAYSDENLEERISRAIEMLIDQGVTLASSFIDVDSIIGLRALKIAIKVREKYKNKINIKYVLQPLEGLVYNDEAREVFIKACELTDIIGGLPSRDRPEPEKHLDIIFELAKKLNKPVHVHIDQENNPNEHDTELLCQKTIEHGLQGKVWAVHAISVSAQPEHYQDKIIALMKEAGVAVVICPRAALGMKQLGQFTAPLHNSIAPFKKMLDAGVPISFGVDNIADLFQPFVDGDMLTEMLVLMEAARFYDYKKIAEIATDRSCLA